VRSIASPGVSGVLGCGPRSVKQPNPPASTKCRAPGSGAREWRRRARPAGLRGGMPDRRGWSAEVGCREGTVCLQLTHAPLSAIPNGAGPILLRARRRSGAAAFGGGCVRGCGRVTVAVRGSSVRAHRGGQGRARPQRQSQGLPPGPSGSVFPNV